MTVADQQVRDRALDIRDSFAVSAPAGSGKTGLLIRRILKLLATCESPEQVLAITFTRKAAAEMQERIVAALAAGRAEQPPADDYQLAIWQDAKQVLARDKEKGWQLLAAPSRLRIMTIDSLCRDIARQMAVETALGELPQPSDQPEMFYRDAIRQFFDHLDRPGAVGDALAVLLEHLDNNLATLENLLESLLTKREQWLEPLMAARDAREYLEQALQNTVAETLTAVRKSLMVHGSELATLADYAAANLIQSNSASAIIELAGLTELPGAEATVSNLAHWQALTELLLTQSDSWRKTVDKRTGFPTKKESVSPESAQQRKDQLLELLTLLEEQHPELLQLLIDLRNLPGVGYSDAQWQLLEALTAVLPRLVAELSILFKSRHSCDFTEVTLAALHALGDEDDATDLSLKLDYQIRHILVDEFQDTSSLQFRLLKQLTGGWQAGDGRTLFVVGDGMQSLYGFRNANVGIFLEARKMPIGDIQLKALDLTVNFRSDQTLVNWVNQCFAEIFPRQDDISRGAVSYSQATAAKSGTAGCRITLDRFDQETTLAGEAEQILAHIRAARLADAEGSIAILVRARSHLNHIIPVLQEQGIAWEATDIDPLSSRMPVIDLHSLTRALLNPADRIAWLSVLRAPWCGLTLCDLHALSTAGSVADGSPDNLPWLGGQLFNPQLFNNLSDDGRDRLERVGTVLAQSWQNRFRKPLRQWVEGTWLALGGPATLLNCNEMAWCQQYLDLLENHATGSAIDDMAQFAKAVGKLYASPASQGGNAVKIMTIHKSKGLEFDTVILPSLHKGGAPNASELLFWRERINARGETELLISPLLSPLDQDNAASSKLVSHLKYEKKLKESLEDARVLYVACTRAIKRLHLLYREPSKSPTSGSLLASLWPALENSQQAGGGHLLHQGQSSAPVEEEQPAPATLISRLTANWQHPHAELVAHPAPDPNERANDPSHQTGFDLLGVRRQTSDVRPISFTATSTPQQHIGTVLHRTLGQITREGVARWNDERIASQSQVWHLQLRQLGVSDLPPAIELLKLAVRNILSDDKGRWLLSSKHRQSACEQAIGHQLNGNPTLSVIDRTFVDDGVRWIVDYKSSQPREGETLEAFLVRETTTYREQLLRYREVFARREPDVAIRTALYFPLVPRLALMS